MLLQTLANHRQDRVIKTGVGVWKYQAAIFY